jgi:hypothetical protein
MRVQVPPSAPLLQIITPSILVGCCPSPALQFLNAWHRIPCNVSGQLAASRGSKMPVWLVDFSQGVFGHNAFSRLAKNDAEAGVRIGDKVLEANPN